MLKNVLVFGATSAVARAMMNQLSKNAGSQFYAVARNQQKLQQLSSSPLNIVAYRQVDLYQPQDDQLHQIVDEAYQAMGAIDLVIIAHGDLFDQLGSERSGEVLSDTMTLNAISPMRITNAVLQRLDSIAKPECKTKFAVLTSVAGDRGRPRNFSYGAAKGALSLFLQGLRSVHYRSEYQFYDFKLGPVESPMTTTHAKNFSFSQPDQVAAIMVKALYSRRYVHYVPGWWRWVMLAVCMMPECIFQRLSFLSAR
ncbi:MAG: SDR family NAD(P)-dependent oxidoreductase [Pseudomonadales bacterium]|nr:SDR family NAD(P)-dependent oxidoreductase [Pseudomonadales bacterium]